MSFKDHFSTAPADYAAYRPHYPPALFAFVGAESPGRNLAWDCATGTGQAAVGLADHFRCIIATDASAAQVAHAEPHERVSYRVAPAEASGLAHSSADAVVVAQALHWFDLAAFYAEAKRVLVPHGLIVVWCYDLLTVAPEVDSILMALYSEVLGPYWPPERHHVESGYRTLEFPFREFQAPRFTMEASLNLAELGGYLRTWSAARRYQRETGVDSVAETIARLTPRWGDPERRRAARWPLSVRAGRRDAGT